MLYWGSAGSWGNVSKGSQRDSGQDAHRAPALHPLLTSELERLRTELKQRKEQVLGRQQLLGSLGSQGITPLVQIKKQRSQDSGFLSHPGWQTHPSPSVPNLRLRGGVGRVSEGDAGQKSCIPLMQAAG